MKTSTIPAPAPQWHVVDAENQSLGRISAMIAHVIRGKHRPTFSPHQLCGDHVVVINVDKLALDARKMQQKEYVKHTGYIGHIKATPLKDMMEKKPEVVLEKSVKGMLPKNKLRAQMMKRLHVFTGSEHTYGAQKPSPLTITK